MERDRHFGPKIKTLVVVALVLVLSSCVHRTPYVDEYYFQALGDPGQIVVTVDTTDPGRLPLDTKDPGQTFFSLLERVDRLSVELYDPMGSDSDEEVLTAERLSSYRFRGALEGNIPAFLTNSALLWDDAWDKVEPEAGVRYYHNAWLGIDVYAPNNGLLLFANDGYLEHYRESYKERKTNIPYALAQRMASSLFGVYIGSPRAMIDVGLAIPRSVLMQSESLVFVIEEGTGGHMQLGGIITMKSERLANSLSILLKSSYISDKRRNKEPLGDLTNLFVLQDNAVYIHGMALSDEQYAAFSAMFGSLASLSTGVKR